MDALDRWKGDKMKHTKEPWKVSSRRATFIINPNSAYTEVIAQCYFLDNKTEEENAKRIVGCVNACAGMKNPVEDIAELKKQLVWRDAIKELPEERLLVIVRMKSKFYEPHFDRDFWIATISNVQNGAWEGIDQGYEVMEWLPIPKETTED